jgi:hypothetical protein
MFLRSTERILHAAAPSINAVFPQILRGAFD